MPSDLQSHIARNREHQRQSRARRKEYIADLERRVRQYESEEIKATAEVQSAARKVADENRALRDLLHAHGVSPHTVDAHLAVNEQTGKCRGLLPVNQAQLSPPARSVAIHRENSPTSTMHRSSKFTVEEKDGSITSTSHDQSTVYSPGDNPPDETDCEHAARIIASMRGEANHDSLWSELGCTAGSRCMIKNVKIFQMA